MLRQLRTLTLACAIIGLSQTSASAQLATAPSTFADIGGMSALTGVSETDAKTADAMEGAKSPSAPLPMLIEKDISVQPSADLQRVSRGTLQFLMTMNAYRISMESGTREGLRNPLFSGYLKAIGNLHGWSDGDEFYVNYVGHPMEGAVASFIWMNNDRAYSREHIGWNPNYAKAKLRAGIYAFVLSELSEIGPISEASIGQIQRYYPATGFVDHVITPTVGSLWSVAEDAIDNSLVRYVEAHSESAALRVLARSVLNPAHSFANLMDRRYPWYRTNRPAPTIKNSSVYYRPVAKKPVVPPDGIAPWQFNLHFETRTYFGGNAAHPCVGGAGELGVRIASNWQIVGEVTGCKQTGMAPNFTGDSLTYAIGPQWTGRLSSHWIGHTRLLLGGNKVSQEQFFPELKRELMNEHKGEQNVFPPLGQQYTKTFDDNAFSISTGGGFDYKLSRAFLLRSSLDYFHTWNRSINNINYRDSLRFSSGIVLNVGTW